MRRLSEAANLPESDRVLMAEVKRIVIGMLPDAQVLLYGSAARGEREPDSDYDVLVLTDSPLPGAVERAVHDAVYDLELARGVVISLAIYTRGDWDLPLRSVTPYRRNVEREGILL
jgi:predicted nucleotidyltransferase